MAVTRPGYVWSGTEWVPIGSPVDATNSLVTDHDQLTGRNAATQHPTAAITNLDTTLANKSDTSHTHSIYDIAQGEGITVSGGNPNVITNVDRGTVAVTAHVGDIDPHAGGYSLPDHLHTGTYSDVTHTHSYDPLGSADNAVQAHVADGDPHPLYLDSAQIIPGPGIAVQDNGAAGVLITAISEGGITPVVGIAYGQTQNRNMADGAYSGVNLDLKILLTMDATAVLTSPFGFRLGPNAPAGFYQCSANIGWAGNITGSRRVLVSKNSVQTGNPLVAQFNLPSVGSALNTFTPTNGIVIGAPGDLIKLEGFQNSGGLLATNSANTYLSLLYLGPEASEIVP